MIPLARHAPFTLFLLLGLVGALWLLSVNTVQSQTSATAPQNVVLAPRNTPGSATLSWSAPATAPTGGYRVQWRLTSQAPSWPIGNVITTTATDRTVTGLTEGAAYDFRVGAISSGTTTWAATVSATMGTTATNPNVTGVALNAPEHDEIGQLTVRWTPGGLTGPDGYTVQWKSGTQSFNSERAHLVRGHASSSYTITGLEAGVEYSVQVRRGDIEPARRPSNVVTAHTILIQPATILTGLKAVNAAGNRVAGVLTAEWASSPGAESYTLQWRSGNQGWGASRREATVPAPADAETVSHTITGLTGATRYQVRVIAAKSGVTDSNPSNIRTEYALSTAPPAATNVSAVPAGTGGYLVTWDLSTDETVDEYEIRYSGATSGTRRVVAGDLASQFVTGVVGQQSTVVVRASGPYALGHSDSAAASVTPLATPAGTVTGVSASSSADRTIAVSWTEVEDADGYKILWARLTDAGHADPAFIASRPKAISGGSTTTATLTSSDGLVGGESYRVWVLATESGKADSALGTTSSSDVLVEPVTLPQNVSIAPRNTPGRATLSWDAPTTAPPMGYRIEWRLASQAPAWPTANAVTITDTDDSFSHTVTGLTEGVAYDFRVGTTSLGRTSWAPVVSATMGTTSRALPGPSVDGVAIDTPTVAGELSVRWTLDETTNQGYTVQWKSGSQEFSTTERSADVNYNRAVGHTISRLEPGVEYSVRVWNGPLTHQFVHPSHTVTAHTLPVQSAPAISSLEPVNAAGTRAAGVLTVTWTASTAATGYKVQWRGGDQVYSTTERIHIAGSDATSYTITGLTGAVIHSVRVSAVGSGVGDSAPAEASEYALSAAPPAAANVTATPAGTGGYLVTWDLSADPTVDTYEIRYSGATSGAVSLTSGDLPSHFVTGVAGQQSTVVVRASGPYSLSHTDSAAATVTPLADAAGTVAAVSASSPASGAVTVSWARVEGADGYKLFWSRLTGEAADTPVFIASSPRLISGGGATTATLGSADGLVASERYRVWVLATESGKADSALGPSSSADVFTQPVIAPRNVFVRPRNTPGRATLRWDAPAAKPTGGYRIEWRLASEAPDWPTGNAATVTDSGDSVSYTVTGLTEGTLYDFRVGATASGTTTWAPVVSATMGTTSSGGAGPSVSGVAIDTPTVGGELSVRWTPDTTVLQGYTLQWKSGSQEFSTTERQAVIGSNSAGGHTISRLEPGVEYSVRVWQGPLTHPALKPSHTVTAHTLPIQATPAIASLEPENSSGTRAVGVLTVEWAASTAAAGYTVQWRSGDQDYSTSERIHVAGANATSYTITGLTGATEYDVRLVALGSGVRNSQPSEDSEHALTAAPAAPTNVTAVPAGLGGMLVTWDPSTDPTVNQYEIRATTGSSSTTTATVTSGDLSGYYVSGAADQAYTVVVRATSPYGLTHADSASTSVTTLADAAGTVADVSATSSADSSITVSWNQVENADGYKIFFTRLIGEAKDTPAFISDAPKTVSGGATLTADLTSSDGLVGSVKYRVWVLATQAGKAGSALGTTSSADVVTRPVIDWLTAYSIPHPTTPDGTKLAWSPVQGAHSYLIELRTGPSEQWVTIATVTTSSHDQNHRANRLFFRVTARFENEDGTFSNGPSIEAVGAADLPELTDLTAAQIADENGSLNVSWTSTDGRQHFTVKRGYQLQWKPDGGEYNAPVLITDADTTTYKITGLTANTRYTVKAAARYGPADPSVLGADLVFGAAAETEATTSGFGPVSVAPAAGTEPGLAVSWPVAPGADGYFIEWKLSSASEYPQSQRFGVVGGDITTRTISPLAAATSYDVRVTPYEDRPSPAPTVEYAPATGSSFTYEAFGWMVAAGVAGNDEALDVSWAPVSAAHSYRVQWRLRSEADFNTGQTVTAPAASYRITGLTPRGDYVVRVTVRVNQGISTLVDQNYLEDDAAPDDYPSLVYVSARPVADQPAGLAVDWAPAADAIAYDVQVKASGGDFRGPSRVTTGETITFSGTTGTEHTVRAAAIYMTTHQVRGPFTEATGTPGGTAPARAPLGDITVSSVTTHDQALEVAWAAVADGHDYLVQWKLPSAASYNEGQAATGTSYEITGLTPNTAYDVRVTVRFRHRGAVEPGTSSTGSANTAASSALGGLTVTPALHTPQIEVAWDAYRGSRAATGGYLVQWRSGDEAYSTTTRSHTVDSGDTSYTITGLAANTSYTVKVTARQTTGATTADLASAEATATTVDQLRWLTVDDRWINAVPFVRDAVDVQWNRVEGASSYLVQWRPTGGTYDAGHAVSDPSVATHTIGVGSGATDVQVRVTVRFARSDGSLVDGNVLEQHGHNPVSGTVRPTASPILAEPTALNVSWGGVLTATGYRIQWRTGSVWYNAPVDVASTSYKITGLTPNTRYTVRVVAKVPTSGNVRTSGTEVVSATTAEALGDIAVERIDASTTSLKVAWTTLTGATGYLVQWKSGNQTYSTTERNATATADATSHTITGLTAGAAYSVKVTARHGTAPDVVDGDSSEASGSPHHSLGTVSVAPKAASTDTLVVSWTAIPDAGGYLVQWKSGGQTYSTTTRNATAAASATSAEITGLTAGTSHDVRVSAWVDGDASDPDGDSAEATGSTFAQFGTVTVTPVAGDVTRLSVSWPAMTGASGYRVEWKLASASNFNLSAAISSAGYTITGLAPGTTYTVRITARYGTSPNVVDGDSTEEIGTTYPALGTVTVAKVDYSAAHLDVSWPSVAAASGYLVQWKTGSENYSTTERNHEAAGTATGYRIGALAADTEYEVRVTARHGTAPNVIDGDSADAKGTTHPALAGLTATPVAGTLDELNVSWQTVTGAAGYTVHWKSGAQTYGAADRTASVTAPATSHKLTGLAVGTAYGIRVAANFDVDGSSVPRNVSEITASTVPALTGLDVSPLSGHDRLDVSWSQVNGATGYRVEWKLDTASSYPSANTADITSGATVAHQITGLTAATAYDVRVIALNTTPDPDVILAGAEASGTTLSALTGLQAALIAGKTTEVEVAWGQFSGAEEYLVQWKLETAASFNSGMTASGAKYTITGLAAGTWYDVRVTAFDTDPDPDVAVAVANTRGRPLPELTGLTVTPTAGKTTELSVSWNEVEGTDDYRVSYKTGAGDFSSPTDVTSTESTISHTITGLAAGTTYTVKVTAWHADFTFEGDSSEATGATHPALSGLSVDPVEGHDTQLSVSWSEVTGAAGYIVEWKTGSESYSSQRRVNKTGASTTSHTITGLEAGTAYTVKVTAYTTGNANSPNGDSDEGSGTTSGTIASAAKVTGVAVEPPDDPDTSGQKLANQLKVTWAQSTGATGYKVQWKSGSQEWDATNRQSTVSSGATLTVTLTGLTGSTDYTVRVIAVKTGAPDSDPSDEITATAFSTSPAAVTNVKAVPLGTRVLVTFTPSTDPNITKYEIHASQTGNPVRVEQVSNGNLYEYRPNVSNTLGPVTIFVRATSSSAVTHSDSANVTATPLSQAVGRVSGITAASSASGEITVNWTESTNAQGYEIYFTRLAGDGLDQAAFITDSPKVVSGGSTTTATLSSANGIEAGLSYRVWVVGTADGYAHSAIPTDTDVSVKPTLEWLTVDSVSGVNNAVDVNWNRVAGAHSYLVQWKVNSSGSSYSSTDQTVVGGSASPTTRIGSLSAFEREVGVYVRVIARFADDDGSVDNGSLLEVLGAAGGDGLDSLTAAAVADNSTQLTVTWSDDNSATTGYLLQWKPQGGSYNAPTEVTAGTTTYTITGLEASTAYTVKVSARHPKGYLCCRGAAAGVPSEATATTSESTTPDLPGLTVAPVAGSSTKLSVSWQAVADATGYLVQWKTGSETYSTTVRNHTAAANATSYEITGLSGGTSYDVKVTAQPDKAEGEVTATSTNVELTGLAVVPAPGSTTALNVSWAAVSNAVNFRVDWKLNSATAYPSENTAEGRVLGTQIPGLTAATAYDVRVTAVLSVDGSNVDGDSAEATATTHGALASLAATPVSGQTTQLSVTWGTYTGAEQYLVQHKTASGTFNTGTTVTTNSHTITGLTAATVYTIRVTAIDTTPDPDATVAVAETTATTAAALASLAAAPVAGKTTELSVTWGTFSGAEQYLVQHKTASGTFNTGTTVTTNSHTITGLTAGTAYTIRVTAIDTTPDPDAIVAVAETTATTAAALAGLTVSPLSDNDQLDVSWSQVNGATGYRVEWKLDTASSYPTANSADITSGTTVAHQITGLTAATAYDVRVTALNTTPDPDVILAVAEASGTTLSALTELQVALVAGKTTELKVGWDLFTGAEEYLVQWKVETAASFNSGVTVTGHERTITGLAAGTWYDVRVTAFDTDPDPDAAVAVANTRGRSLFELTGLTVSAPAGKATELSVSWSKVESATGYRVSYKTGAGDFGSPTDVTSTESTISHTITGLTAGTTYTVKVTAWYGDFAFEGDSAEASGTTNAALDTAPAFANDAAVADQSYAAGTKIADVTLPAAAGGNAPLVYSISPALPAGLGFDAATRVLSGTPTVTSAEAAYTYTVADGDGDTDSLTFRIAVAAGLLPAFAADAAIADLSLIQGSGVNMVLPAASGGTGALTYAITPSLPAGLTFQQTPRKLSGMPTAVQAATNYTYKVTDRAGLSSSLTFTIEVGADLAPSFGGATVADQYYSLNAAITPLVLPAPSGGNGTLTSYLIGTLPAGLELDAATRTISGTPTAELELRSYAWSVRDEDLDYAYVTFHMKVSPLGLSVKPVPGEPTKLDVRWNAHSGAEKYRVQYKTGEGAFSSGAETTGTSHQITGLVHNTAYTVRVTAVDTDADPDADLAYDEADATTVVDPAPSFADKAAISDVAYIKDLAVKPLVLPQASGGDGTLAYTLTPALPAGLEFDASTRTISGAPTANQAETAYTYTVTDSDATDPDTATLAFKITVADSGPLVTNLGESCPCATGDMNSIDYAQGFTTGADTAGYTLTGVEPSLDMFTDDKPAFTVTLHADNSGKPGSALATLSAPAALADDGNEFTHSGFALAANTTYFVVIDVTETGTGDSEYDTTASNGETGALGWTVADTGLHRNQDPNDNTDPGGQQWATDQQSLKLQINGTVAAADRMPSFAGDASIADQSYTQNTAIDNLVLPPASGGDGALTYSITPALPAGLSFTAATRTLSGNPTASQAAATYTYKVTDADGDEASLTFSITIAADLVPAFAGDASIPNQFYTQNTAISPLTLPQASGGDGTLTYSITPAVPAGLTFTSSTRTLSGNPTGSQAAATYTYTVADADGDEATLTFSITIAADLVPAFAANASIDDQSYTLNTAISPLTLPQASGGDGALTYSITPALPIGLSFDPATRILSGRPTATKTPTTYTYKVTDSDASSPDSAELTFTISVSAHRRSSTEVLVGNTGKPVSGHRVPNDVITYAQAFDTGSNANGYELDSVVLAFASAPAVNASLQVTVQEESSTTADTPSGTALYTLTNPGTISTGLNEFAAPADAELSANTTYFVVAEYDSRTGGPGWRRVLLSDGLDSGAAAGWNIDANYLLKVSSGNWGTDSATRAFQIQVKGAARTGSDSSPSFGAMASIPDMAFAVNKPNTSGVLPLATGGDTPLTYSVKEALPAGLSYSSSSGAITGTPTATAAAATYTFVATDSDGDTAELTFSLAVTANSTPSFGMSAVANQVLTKDAAMTPVALPAATGGNAPLRYSFNPTLPAGLSFEKSGDTYRLKGAPTTPQDETSYTWRAEDSDYEFAAVSFTITVMPNAAPSFGAETISNKTYIQHRKITDLTLPAATGGDGALTYTLTGANGAALPAGLEFNSTTRKLTGTPTASQAATTYTYTVTDSDTSNPDSATLTFAITVTANAAPSFEAMASIPDMAFAVNRGSFSTDLPLATGGDAPLTYSVKETLPAGLSYSSSLRSIMGTPRATAAAATYTFVATDSDGDTAELTFSLAVTANSMPSFGMSAVANQVLTKDAAMTPVALPAATGGNAPLRYSFNPTLPAGLSFEKSGDTYMLKGTPTARQDATSYAWRAEDSDYEFAAVSFTITIVQGAAPSFGANTIANRSYTQNTAISDLTLPTATGGDGTLSYALVGTLPAGLEYNSTTRKITGTPTATQAATAYTWRVTDNDGDKAELTFTITVSAPSAVDTEPKWVSDGTFTVLDLVQEFTVGAAVDLTLPRATGDEPLTYSLTPEAGATLPAGLTFYAPMRRLTGVPTTAQPLTGYTYMVTDADGDTAKFDLAISIAVSPGARQHPLIDDIMIVGWTRSTDTGVTGYLIQWKSGDQQYSTTERSHTAGPTDSSSEISDLPLGVYTVRVTQQGGAGDGNSVEYTVTLHGWPGVVYVDPVAGDARAVDVEWEEVSTAAGYVIQWKLASADSYPQANRASVTAGSLNYRTATDGYTGEAVEYPIHRVSDLQPNTEYEAKVTVYTAAGSASSPDGLSHENTGTTHAEITGLTVSAVDSEPNQLTVSWNAPPDTRVRGFEASGYLLQWKTGSDDYNDGTSLSPRTSAIITGLTAGTAYTVRLTVTGTLFGATADGDAAEATGTTSAATGTGQASDPNQQPDQGGGTGQQQTDSTPAVSFVIYHDPDAGDAAADRYNQAVQLLDHAGFAYSEVRGDVQDDVERLAGVTDSDLPRFFLGDPTGEGWVSQPGENNGGLRWLREKLSEMDDDKADAPAGPAALEGLTVGPVSGETGRLAVSWKAVTDADKYLVKWKTGSDDYNSGDEATSASHTITGLTADTAYTVQVTAIDTDADPDVELAVGEATGTTLAAMGTVTVSAVADSSNSLDVSWLAVNGAVGYVVEWKTGDSSYSAVTRADATATSERVTGLEAETAYTVKVTARHTIGGSEANGDSAEGSGTTNAAPAQDPPANTPASGAPSISGTAQVGETLTAATSGISDADGLANASFSYQWLADGSDISGATSSTYTLVAGDVGKAVKVTVSFTDDAGNAESLTSAATAAVVAEDPPEEEPAAVTFVIYHDPNAGDAAVDRYNQGVKLLKDAGISYSEVKGDVQDDVDSLAGVTGSVIPRFFLGDPTEEGWVSETKVNNGGLRWLKGKVAELTSG